MTTWTDAPLATLNDVIRFEEEMPIEQRLPGNSVFDVLTAAAMNHPERTAITMLMSGESDEEPRRVADALVDAILDPSNQPVDEPQRPERHMGPYETALWKLELELGGDVLVCVARRDRRQTEVSRPVGAVGRRAKGGADRSVVACAATLESVEAIDRRLGHGGQAPDGHRSDDSSE